MSVLPMAALFTDNLAPRGGVKRRTGRVVAASRYDKQRLRMGETSPVEAVVAVETMRRDGRHAGGMRREGSEGAMVGGGLGLMVVVNEG